ncbi:MAG TPA: hypothetical protein EYP98_06405 [Planctomycetes bacterium]|nr:hypothetical protein [Planctomycetota bacterium]
MNIALQEPVTTAVICQGCCRRLELPGHRRWIATRHHDVRCGTGSQPVR